MAKTLTQIGIETGNTVEAYHVTQSIDAFTGTEAYDILLSGSFNMTGSINGEPGVINPLTASYAISSSYALTSSHAITASYVLGDINGFGVSPLTVLVTTTASLPNSPVYDNGSSGVGAFLSGSSNGSIGNIDGVSVTVNDRILVKDQTLLRQNGIYEVTQTGSITDPYILTRTTDSDQTSELDPQIVIPSSGSYSGLIFAQQTDSPIVGTDGITYSQIGTNVYVTQTTTGTENVYQIPWWTGISKQLSKGKPNLTFNSISNLLTFTAGSTSMLYVGASSSPYTSGTGSLRAFVRNASSGVTSLASGATLVLDNNTTNYLAILSPNTATSGIYMGSPGDAFGASIRWGYNLSSLLITTQQSGHSINFLVGNKNAASVLIEPVTTNIADMNVYLVLTGSLNIAPTNPLPTVVNGGIAFSSSGDFYFGSGSAWRKLTL